MEMPLQNSRKWKNESVNLIVTDPPYNLNKDYGTSQDKLKFEDYLEFSRLWLKRGEREFLKA